MTTALIVVDVQNDFCPGGALPVPAGDQVVPPLNQLIRRFEERGRPLFFTRDWHPPRHASFQPCGGPWPPHCVAHTLGAVWHPSLRIPAGAVVISKATLSDEEAYSGFAGTALAELLEQQQVDRVVLGGLATDYCVKHTVLDARKVGLDVTVIEDAIRAVEVHPGDGDRAREEMKRQGALMISLKNWLAEGC